MKRKKTPEGYVKSAVLEYLAAKKIFSLRVNSGAIMGSTNGKTWCVKMAPIGTADILALMGKFDARGRVEETIPIWIETKAPKGELSPEQKDFKQDVEARGHGYVLARSIDDVTTYIEKVL